VLEFIVPGLLEPIPDDWLPRTGLTLLERMLSRADAARETFSQVERNLCTRFGLRISDSEEVPAGALGLLGDGGDPGDGFWLCADPVHLVADRDRVMLFPIDGSAFSPAQTASRADLFNKHFSGDGWYLEAPSSTRWYLRAPRPLQVTTHPLHAVSGRSLDAFLPEGPDARLLRRMVAECEMLFHAAGGMTADQPPGPETTNSLWVSGGGTLPKGLAASFEQVVSSDPLALGLARSAGIPGIGHWRMLSNEPRTLVYETRLRQALSVGDEEAFLDAFRRLLDALAEAGKLLAAGKVTRIRIGDGLTRRWTVTTATQRRWWRRRRDFTSFQAV